MPAPFVKESSLHHQISLLTVGSTKNTLISRVLQPSFGYFNDLVQVYVPNFWWKIFSSHTIVSQMMFDSTGNPFQNNSIDTSFNCILSRYQNVIFEYTYLLVWVITTFVLYLIESYFISIH